MSFWKCCIGADQRPDPESIRPVATSHRRGANPSYPDAAVSNKKKVKLPTEVFFDPSKPDGQLSSVTDPPNSIRDYPDPKKRKDIKDRRISQQRERKSIADDRPDLEAPDNNGLTRGQNFMKVEKWLRQSSMYQQIDITPRNITNIEDTPANLPENTADPPSEKDRLPPALANQLASARSR